MASGSSLRPSRPSVSPPPAPATGSPSLTHSTGRTSPVARHPNDPTAFPAQLHQSTPAPKTAPLVAQAFRLRATGATVMEVRDFLREHGVERSFHGVQSLLGSRVVLGELRFGDLVNRQAHDAIVDEVTWQKVQRMRLP